MDLKNKFCPRPFEYLEIGFPQERGILCHACCPNQLPREVGNLKDETITEVWNSTAYQEIRESILKGSFDYCVSEQCPQIQSNGLPDRFMVEDPYLKDIIKKNKTILPAGPRIINLSYDQTCNLSCPSCRVDFISHNGLEAQITFNKIGEDIIGMKSPNLEKLLFCSSGDPFASIHFKSLMKNIDFGRNPQLEIQIVTNGLLFNEKVWRELSNIHGRISLFCISIDAGSKEVYKIVRRGGDWSKLLENLKFIKELRERGEIPFVKFDFVVQDYNFKEMPIFVELGKRFSADIVFFQRIINWGTYSKEEFKTRAIYREDHPLYNEFVKICELPIMRDSIVDGGNLSSFIGTPKRKFRILNAIKHSLQKRVRFLR